MTQKHPIEIIREGSIAASVWERTGKRGRYFEFKLSRSYKTDEGFAYSLAFHDRDAETLGRVIVRAEAAIRTRSGATMPPADESLVDPSSNAHAEPASSVTRPLG